MCECVEVCEFCETCDVQLMRRIECSGSAVLWGGGGMVWGGGCVSEV